MAKKSAPESAHIGDAQRAVEILLRESIATIRNHLADDTKRLCFPSGIQSLEIEVKLRDAGEMRLVITSNPRATGRPEFAGTLVDPQTIVDSCEAHWDSYKSDCSGFVKTVAADFGIVLNGQADDIVDQMNSSSWQSAANGIEAKSKADTGYLVLAGLKGADHTPPRSHGHVVVVVTGPLANGKYPTAYWGSLGGVGKKNATLNYAWNSSDRDNVIYRFTELKRISR